MKKRFYWHLCCVFLLPLALLACESALRREQEIFTQNDVTVEVGRGVEILYSDSARVRVRIKGPVLLNFTERDDPRQEFPEGIIVDFLDDRQAVKSTLTAKTAVRRQDKGQVTARDSVVLNTAQRERLETEELIWDEKTEKVFTDKFVKVIKPGEIIYGFGLEANQDFSYWKITVPKGRIKADQVDKALQ
ncbi:MAG: LPS export ABC transporter periplasmic protein LptC [Saprospiraceae bacterium]|nr:LPS export ABC transporter periplasmic protein LptC [Saprospiraceae bacterium]